MNIYDYFYSEEVVKEFKKANHTFSYKEMFGIIYFSYKPIDFKIQGLKYIIENCKDYDLIIELQKAIESYEELLLALEWSEGESYYKVKFEDAPYDLCPVFRTYDDAKEFINNNKNTLLDADYGEYDASGLKERYSITKTEYFNDGETPIELKFIYDINDNIVDVKMDGERYLEKLDYIYSYINTPIIFENNGMKIVNIYNPDFEETEDTYLLSNNQAKYHKLRSEERENNNEVYYKSDLKQSGPVSEYLSISREGKVEKQLQYIYEFMNMYIVDEEYTYSLDKHMKLKVERAIIKKMIGNNNNE